MENKNIILIILIIVVIYSIFCNIKNTKEIKELKNNLNERFTTGTVSSLTESIINIGNISEQIMNDDILTIPASKVNLKDLDVTGNLNVNGNLHVEGNLNFLPVGTIVMWTKSYIPNGWAECNGNNYTPDLRGRFVLGSGQGSGLTNRNLNDRGPNNGNGVENGGEKHKLTVDQMPSHKHGNSKRRGSMFIGSGMDPNGIFGDDFMQKLPDAAGGSQAHNNMPPYYVLIYIMKVN